MTKGFVRPVWHRQRSDALSVDVARIVGYRAASSDGWRGPVRNGYAAARLDLHEHKRQAAGSA